MPRRVERPDPTERRATTIAREMAKAKAPSRPSTSARSVEVRGVVQGVGFRPFVWRLADRHGVSGWVRNRWFKICPFLLAATAAALLVASFI